MQVAVREPARDEALAAALASLLVADYKRTLKTETAASAGNAAAVMSTDGEHVDAPSQLNTPPR